MITLPVNPDDAVTGDCALELPVVIADDHAAVVIDNKGQQWPVFWANVKTCIEHGGLPPTFSNLDIPERIPYLRDVFPKMWNYDQDQVPDSLTWSHMFESIAGCKADGNNTVRGNSGGRTIAVDALDESGLDLRFMKGYERPLDPREPMGMSDASTPENNFIGVKLASSQIKAKRSAFKPRVFADHVHHDSLPTSSSAVVGVTLPGLKKHVRRIFSSKRRCQWTLAGTNFVQIESPINLIRYLSALGFEPSKLKPTGRMLTARSHNVSFLAEYKGALFVFADSNHSHYDVWRCEMFTDSSMGKFAPYSIPGFEFGDYHMDKRHPSYTPETLDMGSFNFIGSRGVPAPLENMSLFSHATANAKRRHDTRPFRYGLQIRYRWLQCMKLVQQIMGDAMQSYTWECSTIPGPSLLHVVKWSDMPYNLRFTLATTQVIHSRIKEWAAEYEFIKSIDVQFQASTSEIPADEDDILFNRSTPFKVEIHMPDITPPEDQAQAMTAFFVELPGIIEKVVEDDPNNCR